MKAYNASAATDPVLVHTGRYDDWALNEVFLRDVAIPNPTST